MPKYSTPTSLACIVFPIYCQRSIVGRWRQEFSRPLRFAFYKNPQLWDRSFLSTRSVQTALYGVEISSRTLMKAVRALDLDQHTSQTALPNAT